MDFDVLFTGLAVSDFAVASAWYGCFFARPADVVAHESEVMWQVTDRAWLYIVHDGHRAGNGIAALSVPDITEATAAALEVSSVWQ